MQSYKVIATKVLFEHPAARILVETIEHQGKQRAYFYLASPVEAVATLGVKADGCILLTRQYRHPIRSTIYDLPAGRLNPGESPLDGARREFEEETGYFPRRIEKLGYYNQFPGTLRAATTLFFASDLVPTQQNLDEGEELEVVALPAAQVLNMVLSGEIIDGSLQLALLLALQKGLITLSPIQLA